MDEVQPLFKLEDLFGAVFYGRFQSNPQFAHDALKKMGTYFPYLGPQFPEKVTFNEHSEFPICPFELMVVNTGDKNGFVNCSGKDQFGLSSMVGSIRYGFFKGLKTYVTTSEDPEDVFSAVATANSGSLDQRLFRIFEYNGRVVTRNPGEVGLFGIYHSPNTRQAGIWEMNYVEGKNPKFKIQTSMTT